MTDQPRPSDKRRPRLADERTPADERSPSRAPAVIASVTALALLAGAAWWVRDKVLTPWSEVCRATAAGETVSFDPEQMHNAAMMVQLAEQRGLAARAGSIAVATAIQESKLRNITYGDRDSVGLFQQRPSQGWGTEEQILDPHYATNTFYDALVKVDGWQDMRITEIAQEVQRSGFPDAYGDHEGEGRAIASVVSGHSPEGMVCRLDSPGEPGDPDAVVDAVTQDTGHSASADGQVVTITTGDARRAWGTAAWAVAQAKAHRVTSVTIGTRTWQREDWKEWQEADAPAPDGQVVLTLAD